MASGHHYSAKRRRLMKRTAERSKSEFPFHTLPEGIMDDIVSRLAMKDAVRLSSVSTNCRLLWTYHPNLCFDSPTMLNRKSGSRRKLRRDRFISRVNAFLESHSGIGVRRFKVAFPVDARHAEHLDRWFSFVLASGAAEITIDLLPEIFTASSISWKRAYTLPSHMFSSQSASHIESLRLVFVSLKLPDDFYGFQNLRVLDLQYVYISTDLELLLSKCNALESLSLHRCYPLANLKAQKPLWKLHYLSIRQCYQESMEIHVPNLTNFEYLGRAIPIALGESRNLKEATMTLVEHDDNLDQVFTELPKTVSHVERLFVNTCLQTQVVGFSKNLQKFTHLVKLEMTISVLGNARYKNGIMRLACLLEVAPLLQKLELNMLPHVSSEYIAQPEDYWSILPCTHHHLERVDISGFIGLKGQVELALYILENAASLRCMTIEPRMTARDRVMGFWEGLDCEIKFGRRCAFEFLSPEDYPNVQIEIL